MSKEGLSPYQAHEKRIDFIGKAVGEGVLDKIPLSERDQNIALVYYLNEELTGEKVGSAFPQSSGKPLGRESVRQKGEKFLRAARNAASPQLQAENPLAELLARKPSSLAERTLRVKNMTGEGLVSQINIENAGLSSLQLCHARTTLKRRGIEVPLLRTFANFEEKVEAENDNQKLQALLESFTPISLRGYYSRHRKDKEKILTDLSSVLREGEFYPSSRSLKHFAQKVKEKNIPIRPVERVTKTKGKYSDVYYIVYSKHAKEIADALRDDPDLQRFRNNSVQLVFGTFNGQLPTTTELVRKKGYEYVGNLVAETLGIRIGGNAKVTTSALLVGCEMPIFRQGGNFFFPLDQKTEFQVFLRKRYEVLKSAGNPTAY